MADRFSRRDVLAMGAGVLAFSPVVALADLRIKKPVKFGLITDVHHGLAPDALQRLRVFIDEARTRDLDFVIQVGDFNHPTAEARAFLDVWSDYRGPRYGVLGNHDMDMGTKEDAIQFWSIPSRYYAFDSGELHCVVLDANNIYENGRYEAYANANFYRGGSVISHIDDEQFDWFAHEVFTTKKQTIVFVHQPIDEGYAGGTCPNRHRARAIIEEANRRAGWKKVVACFQGHLHIDGYEERRGVHYFRMNSSSYAWVGEQYGRMAPYDRSLFAFVTVGDGHIKVEGRSGKWKDTSPAQRGVPGAEHFSASIDSHDLSLR